MIDINAQIRLGLEQALDRLNVWSHQGGDGRAYIEELIEHCNEPGSADLSKMLADALVEIVNLKASSRIMDVQAELVRVVLELMIEAKSKKTGGVVDLREVLQPLLRELRRVEHTACAEFTGQAYRPIDHRAAARPGNEES